MESVAIKIIDVENYRGPDIHLLVNEVQMLKLLRHENLLTILAAFVADSELWIVTPLLAGGSCRQLLRTVCPDGIQDENLIAKILRDALQGIVYLHKNNVIHRDIKAGGWLPRS